MRSLLLRILSGLSAVLCLACLSIWIKSYWAMDVLERSHYSLEHGQLTERYVQFISSRGTITMLVISGRSQLRDNPKAIPEHYQVKNLEGWQRSRLILFSESAREYFVRQGGRDYLGFGYTSKIWETGSSPELYISRRLLLPSAFPTALFAIAPVHFILRFMRWRRRQTRISTGLCPNCGYDMRSSPDQCPECGTSRQPITTSAV